MLSLLQPEARDWGDGYVTSTTWERIPQLQRVILLGFPTSHADLEPPARLPCRLKGRRVEFPSN